MNPETNKFEPIFIQEDDKSMKALEKAFKATQPETPVFRALRADGTPVPEHWTILSKDEKIVIKNYTFKVAYIGESYLVLEPVGIVDLSKQEK
jgi:hypothetical protein